MPIQIYGTQLDFFSKIQSNQNIDFYIDTLEYYPNSHIKVFFQSEPLIIHTNMNRIDYIDYLSKNFEKYDYIFLYDPFLLQVPNVHKKICGGTWIPKENYLSINTSKKEFQISNLTGFKNLSAGHTFRHQLYINQQFFQEFPIVFFRSSAPPIIPEILTNPLIPKELTAKTILFDTFQFSIVIENTREKNCFSEKIIDCLITKTIPIYYGCENISEYFDTTGWILLSDIDFLETLYQKLKTLTPSYYQEHSHVIEENYKKACEMADLTTNYFTVLSKVLPISLIATS
jgi:hypothetical protein